MFDHLRPLYATRFRCLGEHCDDNCCRNWEIPIDRASYQRLERWPGLQVRHNFSFIQEGATEERHALIRLDASGNCPFLSGKGLCTVQQQYGDDTLPVVCATYPRNPRRVDGLMEVPLSLSCIEAARLVLLDHQLLRQDPAQTGDRRYASLLALAQPAEIRHPRDFRYFWQVREFCLLLVTDHSYPLWQRLFLLGVFSKRLGEICAAREFGFVPRLLREYAEIVASGRLRSAMEGIPVRAAAQVQMVAQVAFAYLSQHKPELCRIRDCLQDFLQGVGYEADASLEACTKRYSQAYEHDYRPFMDAHPLLLENYLVNHIFRMVFPFGQDAKQCFERPQQEFLMLCLEFAVMKGLLIGMAGRYGDGFAVEHVLKLVQCLAKTLEHDRSLDGMLNWQELSDSECIAALLKN